jgi:hypothetical protein
MIFLDLIFFAVGMGNSAERLLTGRDRGRNEAQKGR